jgi:hypothetical protein
MATKKSAAKKAPAAKAKAAPVEAQRRARPQGQIHLECREGKPVQGGHRGASARGNYANQVQRPDGGTHTGPQGPAGQHPGNGAAHGAWASPLGCQRPRHHRGRLLWGAGCRPWQGKGVGLDRVPSANVYVRFSNRPVGVKRFQAVHHYCSVDVARGLVLLFGIGAKAFP